MAFSLPSMPLRDCNFRLKQFVRIKGTRGACPTYSLVLGMGVMTGAHWVPNGRWRLSFLAKKTCLSGVWRHLLCLHSHPSGCNFRLDQFIWVNATNGIYHTPRFDSWGHGARTCPLVIFVSIGDGGRFVSILLGRYCRKCTTKFHVEPCPKTHQMRPEMIVRILTLGTLVSSH